MKFLQNFGQRFNQAEEIFVSLLLLAMIFLAVLQIFMRILFDSGFVWADPLLRHFVLWAGMFGAALATKHGKHITIDIFSHLLPDWGALWLNLILNLFAAAVSSFLTWAAFVFIKNEIVFGSGREIVGISVWVLNLVFPFSFSLMAVRYSVKAYEQILTILQPKISPSGSL